MRKTMGETDLVDSNMKGEVLEEPVTLDDMMDLHAGGTALETLSLQKLLLKLLPSLATFNG